MGLLNIPSCYWHERVYSFSASYPKFSGVPVSGLRRIFNFAVYSKKLTVCIILTTLIQPERIHFLIFLWQQPKLSCQMFVLCIGNCIHMFLQRTASDIHPPRGFLSCNVFEGYLWQFFLTWGRELKINLVHCYLGVKQELVGKQAPYNLCYKPNWHPC